MAQEATAKAIGIAGQAAGSVKEATTATTSKVTSTFGKVFRRKKEEEQSTAAANSTAICVNCGNEVPTEYKFCPSCGQAMASEKNCVACNEVIPINSAFCPHCGASQE